MTHLTWSDFAKTCRYKIVMLLFLDLIVKIYVSLFIYLSGVEAWSFDQHLGVAVFIPAGCPFQMRNLQVSWESFSQTNTKI